MTRGIGFEVDEFIKQLSCQYLPYETNINGKKEAAALQVRLSPIQLWDVSFPEQHRDVMLTTLFGTNTKVAGKAINERHNKYAWGLRKVLGVDPLPADYKTNQVMPIRRLHMETIGIGMKDDIFVDGIEQI